MQIDRQTGTARWKSLEAELARTRAELADAVARIEDRDAAPDADAASLERMTLRNRKLRARNRQLTEARDDADTANQAKSTFLAAAGHDLRQPLQAMAALQALLADSVRDAGSRALIARLDTSLEAIANLLDTLLDDDRVEDGIARINVRTIVLEDLFETLKEAHGPAAEEEGIELSFAASPALVASDPLLLQQMLSNLVGNALRFTPHGKVLVGARSRGDRVRIEIWDNGIGIAPEMVETIFEAHMQVTPTASSGGQGLGLSIVRSLGILLDHPVSVHSIPGSGSVFVVDVPRAAAAAGVARHGGTPEGDMPVVHVIDDDQAVLESLGDLLAAAGHAVQCHGNAESFLQNWNQARAGCLLVNAALPGVNGLSLLGQLKRQGRMPASIIITGKGDVPTAAAAMRLGTLDFLEKPLVAGTLLASVAHALAIDKTGRKAQETRSEARNTLDKLTKREREVLEMVLLGQPSKNISADLGISERTVENHRAAMMRKTGSRSLAALMRLAIAAETDAETRAG
jgi:two-component system CheB/CheR fusion protein